MISLIRFTSPTLVCTVAQHGGDTSNFSSLCSAQKMVEGGLWRGSSCIVNILNEGYFFKFGGVAMMVFE